MFKRNALLFWNYEMILSLLNVLRMLSLALSRMTISCDTQMEYPCIWLIYYRWCGQLLLSAHSCSGLWSTPLLQCPCLLSMPGCQSLTFEQLSGRWLPLSKSIIIHSRGRGGGWRGPPPPSSIWSFALHPLLCWWTNDQQQLIYFSEVSLEIYFSEVSLENSRLLSNIDSSHCGMIVINHCGMIVIKSLFSGFAV